MDSGEVYTSLLSIPDPTQPNTIHVLDPQGNVILENIPTGHAQDYIPTGHAQEYIPTGHAQETPSMEATSSGDKARVRRDAADEVTSSREEVQPYVAYSPSGKAQVTFDGERKILS